jgi:hypothetical protein
MHILIYANYYEILLRTSYTNKEVKKHERNNNIWNRVLHFKSITITITITIPIPI